MQKVKRIRQKRRIRQFEGQNRTSISEPSSGDDKPNRLMPSNKEVIKFKELPQGNSQSSCSDIVVSQVKMNTIDELAQQMSYRSIRVKEGSPMMRPSRHKSQYRCSAPLEEKSPGLSGKARSARFLRTTNNNKSASVKKKIAAQILKRQKRIEYQTKMRE